MISFYNFIGLYNYVAYEISSPALHCKEADVQISSHLKSVERGHIIVLYS